MKAGVRMSKKLFALCSIMATVLLTSCSSTNSELPKQETSNVGENVEESTVQESDVNAEGSVIYDDEILRATYLGISDSFGYTTLVIELENKTDSEITVFPMNSSVDDTMITFTSGMPATMQGGKRMKQGWLIGSQPQSNVEFSLSICDEHMHEIKKTDVLRIDMNE